MTPRQDEDYRARTRASRTAPARTRSILAGWLTPMYGYRVGRIYRCDGRVGVTGRRRPPDPCHTTMSANAPTTSRTAASISEKQR